MLVLHTERVTVGEPITDDDFRLFIMPSAVPGCFNKGHDFLTALKGVPNRHERKGTVIGEQGAKVLIVIARDDLQVSLNECLIRLTDHFFLHRFSCFLCSLSQWGSSFLASGLLPLSLVSSASSSLRSTSMPWTSNATRYSLPRASALTEEISSLGSSSRYRGREARYAWQTCRISVIWMRGEKSDRSSRVRCAACRSVSTWPVSSKCNWGASCAYVCQPSAISQVNMRRKRGWSSR